MVPTAVALTSFSYSWSAPDWFIGVWLFILLCIIGFVLLGRTK